MTYNKENPFPARIKEAYFLTKSGSTRQTQHIVLDIRGSGLTYEVGDCIAVCPSQDREVVSRVLEILGYSGEESVKDVRSNHTYSLRHFLTHKVNLQEPTRKLLQVLVDRGQSEDLGQLLLNQNREACKDFLSQHTVESLLETEPDITLNPDEFCGLLSPLLPRFYSIASSPYAHPEEIHLTVSLVNYRIGNDERDGVCSRFLCHPQRDTRYACDLVPIYVHPHRGFTLPNDPHKSIIMIGPGTGIAPFRAFIQHRVATKSKGKNWLFFGERNRATDFYYDDEWKNLLKTGNLKLDAVFSRDQQEKVYVQHKMLEYSKEIYHWLEQGAYLYVCGDAKRMAKDVEAALITLMIKNDLSEEEAKNYLKQLRQEKRYLRDVY
ncbi:MAG: hypothetical protein Tsb0021_14070 [Chlamydiales bacterium]